MLQLIDIMQLLTPGIEKEFFFCRGLLMTCRDAGFCTKTVNQNCRQLKCEENAGQADLSMCLNDLPQIRIELSSLRSLAFRTPADTKSPFILTLLRRSRRRRPAREMSSVLVTLPRIVWEQRRTTQTKIWPPEIMRTVGNHIFQYQNIFAQVEC